MGEDPFKITFIVNFNFSPSDAECDKKDLQEYYIWKYKKEFRAFLIKTMHQNYWPEIVKLKKYTPMVAKYMHLLEIMCALYVFWTNFVLF